MKTKVGDFIELEYLARTKDDNKIFDLTNEQFAKKNNLYQEGKTYSPIIICLGYNDIVPGLDKQLIDKELGKYNIEVKAEEAFGKKSTELIKLVPTNIFTQQNIKPFPGLHVNLDNIYGVIRSVSGGRTIVDFNHPLAGKDLVYEIEIKRFINNTEDKIKAVLNLVKKDINFSLNNDKLVVKLDLNNSQTKNLEEEIKKRIPEIKEIIFSKTTTSE